MVAQRMQVLDVIEDAGEFLAVNKPQDLVCHPTKGDVYSSLISRARLHLGQPAFLVNRLDRETSGIVLIAKTGPVAGELGKLFAAGEIQKEYVAVVHGTVKDDEGMVDAPLGKDESSQVAVKDRVRSDGAAAQTRFQVERRFTRDGASFSVLRVIPLSGRKHQIRIHLSHIGHPIVGDKLYGADEELYLRLVFGTLTESDRRTLMLPNQALHAKKIGFTWREREFRFETGLPEALRSFIEDGAA